MKCGFVVEPDHVADKPSVFFCEEGKRVGAESHSRYILPTITALSDSESTSRPARP